jgi:hypothetical protein
MKLIQNNIEGEYQEVCLPLRDGSWKKCLKYGLLYRHLRTNTKGAMFDLLIHITIESIGLLYSCDVNSVENIVDNAIIVVTHLTIEYDVE